MNWFSIATVAYLLNAGAALVDKVLLRRLVPHPAVYAFFVSVLGGVVVLAAPFVLQAAAANIILASLGSGVLFTAALFLFYTALRKGETLRVVPLVGSATPVFVLALAWMMLGETLTAAQLVGLALVVLGTFFLAREGSGGRMTARLVMEGSVAALLFAASHVAAKFVYLHHPFLSGLVWRGIGGILGALLLLAFSSNRRNIREALSHPVLSTGALFFVGQALAAVSFFLVNYAFSLGPVTLVNALTGIQYAFLFAAVYTLSRFFPQVLHESHTPRTVAAKVVGILLVSGGIAALFI
ncbi:MAG: EamA family transporter [Candidatus Jorgensenbacteria bacterium]